jgi:hypothetical protein
MTELEKQELYQMICGSPLFGHECGHVGGRLIYDGTMFRCCNQPSCWRVTPRAGKLVRHYWMERRYAGNTGYVDNKIDPLKRSIVNKKIKLLKESPELVVMKLVKCGSEWRINIDGRIIHPKRFSYHWWEFAWEREE